MVLIQHFAHLCFLCEIYNREELLRRYPDVMVGMGRSKDLGQTGPDDAGDKLTKVSIKVREKMLCTK